jgi:Spy/CpxP family protein refolding chaperone
VHREKMQAWRSEHQAELKELRQAHQAARDAKDEAKLKELREKGKALHADAPKLIDALKEVRGVLTPEQQATFDQRLEEAKKRLQRGPGPDGPRGERRRGEGRRGGEGEKPSGSGKKLDI